MPPLKMLYRCYDLHAIVGVLRRRFSSESSIVNFCDGSSKSTMGSVLFARGDNKITDGAVKEGQKE